MENKRKEVRKMKEEKEGKVKFYLTIYGEWGIARTDDWGKTWIWKSRVESWFSAMEKKKSWGEVLEELIKEEGDLFVTLESSDGKVVARAELLPGEIAEMDADEVIDLVVNRAKFHSGSKSDLPMWEWKEDMVCIITVWEKRFVTEDGGETWVMETFTPDGRWLVEGAMDWEEAKKVIRSHWIVVTAEVRDNHNKVLVIRNIPPYMLEDKKGTEVVGFLLSLPD